MNKRLIIIDGHAILHRAYHALPPLTTSRGEIVNAVFGFVSMLLRVINDLRPTHLIITFDRPTPTFRNKIYKEYQAKRPKIDKELISQIDLVHKVVLKMGLPAFEMDGYEADDIIGTLVYKASGLKINPSADGQKSPPKADQPRAEKIKDQKLEVIIVTGDRDILQLVNDNVRVYMPVKGLSESKLYGEKEVEEKFGIMPSQIIDYKALVGDQSDNYPGVAGIGPKTASSLLVKYGTLENIYNNLNSLEGEKVKKKLIEDKESALIAKELATIKKDAPLKIDFDKCRLPNLDRPDIHLLFDELEFRSLIPRLAVKINNQKSKIKDDIKEKKNSNEQISLF